MKKEYSDNTLTIQMEENLVSSVSSNILQTWKEWLAELSETPDIVIDIEKCEIIDSEGINLIIGLYRECTSNSRNFQVTNPSAENLRLFGILKLSRIFGLQPA
ncbi:MAG: STAS domain-containing protein [Opitutales bacterium]